MDSVDTSADISGGSTTTSVDSRSTVNRHVGRESIECWSSLDRYIDRCTDRGTLKGTWSEKRTGLTGYNTNKTNWNANHVQNWFGLVFLAEPCFNSFDRTSSLVLRYSIVLSLYECNTTRMVGRNRTTRAQYTSLQIKKHNTIQNKYTYAFIKTPHIPKISCISLNS